MKDVIELYNDEYCEKNKHKKWRYSVVPELVGILFDHFKPESVIDFGCANGLHIASFKALGSECFGIEGTLSYRKYISENYDGDFAIIDMRCDFDLCKKFELATCIEVLEHLEINYADIAVENIVRHSDILCITASPTVTANFHINAQPKNYWIHKFENTGVVYQKKETEDLQNIFRANGKMPIWMKNDLMIFRR